MRLPKLDNFQENIHQLHQAASLFAPICNVLLEKQPNWIHIAMQSHRHVFETQTFPKGGTLRLNTEKALVMYQRGTGGLVPFPLKLHTQASLFEAILEAMAEDEFAGFFDALEGDSLVEKLLGKIYANKPDALPKAIEDHTHDQKLVYDAEAIDQYMLALDTVFTGVARWRARVNGHLSPIVVWGEHFDLSTLWFKEPDMDDYKSHINIGFAPFTAGSFERPYLYAYAYPLADDYDVPQLDAPLKWETEAYTGIYLAYDDLLDYDDPASAIEALCDQLFTALQGVLGG